MSHNIKQQSYSSAGSPDGGSHDEDSSSHDISQDAGSHMSHHRVQHTSTNEDSNISKHEDSQIVGHGAFPTSHNEGSQTSYLGRSHMLPHGSHQVSHHGGHLDSHHESQQVSQYKGNHVSHHEGHHMPRHEDHNASHHEHHLMSNFGGHQADHREGHHMSHHRGQQKSNYGGKQMPHRGSHQVSHQKGHYIFHNGGHKISHYGHHMSHHEHHQASNHEDQHMSHHGGHHMHYEGHQASHKGIHHTTNKGSHHMDHHGGHHMSHYGGHQMSNHEDYHKAHQRANQISHHGGHKISHYEDRHMAHHAGHHMTPHEGHQISHHEHHHKSHHGGHQISNHGDHHKFHHEGKQKAPSKEISSPKQSSFNHGKKVEFSHGHESKFNSSTGHGSWKSDGLLGANEKQIMQLLNERLSSYLGKVRTLEQENAKFERNISDWYKNNPPKTPPDGTHYFRIIEDLQSQMSALAMENSNIVLSMNNAKLAADDYRSKHEIELQLSNGTAMDMHNLSMVLQTLNGETGELETQVQSLEEEKQELKMNSEEEINYLLTQLGARVNVELNAAPSIDLNVSLSEIRDEYENLMEKNLKEAEEMFLERSAELSREVASGSDQLQSIETELIEMKRCMQALEIELDSEITLNSALMGTLEEVETTFGSKLKGLQSVINNAESELAQIRSDLERQIHEYKKLMDQKTHLELEIATYKRLLDGHDIHVTGHHSTGEQHGSHQTAGYYAEGYAHYTKR